jgi:hypothetical protein
MRTRACLGTIWVGLLLAGLSSSATALTFVQAPGSPYATTNPPFVPDSSGFLGGITSGDFNGDGLSDLAVVDATGLPVFSGGESVTVMLGTRSGGVTMAPGSPINISSGGIFSSTGAIATGDFNGDGRLDLAVVDEIDHTVSILLGDGTGRFVPTGAPIPFSGTGLTSIAVGDFNGDGKQDLAVVNSDLNVLLGDGSGGFTPAPKSPLPQSGFPTSVVAGDFNEEGRSDLAVANQEGYVTVYLSNKAGEFHATPGSPLATDTNPRAITAADLTDNGKLDLVAVNTGSSDVTVLLGNGYGGFAQADGSPFSVPAGPGCTPGSTPGDPESIATGDFDGDGKLDLAIANFGCNHSVAILLGNGEGQFSSTPGSLFNANGNPSGMVAGDFNGDGKPDLAIANPYLGRVTILQNATVGSTGPPTGSTGQAEPCESEKISQAPSRHYGVRPILRKNRLECRHVVVRLRHGRKTKTHTGKCPVRHISATHRVGNGANNHRCLSSRTHSNKARPTSAAIRNHRPNPGQSL